MIIEQQRGVKIDPNQDVTTAVVEKPAPAPRLDTQITETQANAAANFSSLKTTPIATSASISTETNAAQIFLENLYLTTKKKAEKRGEHPAFEALRQRLETIVSPIALQDLEKSFVKAAQARDGLAKATLTSIEERISTVTKDRGLLELVIRQLGGEDILVSEDRIEEFRRVQAIALSIAQESPLFQEAQRGSLEYQHQLDRCLSGIRHLEKLGDITVNESTELSMLRDYLCSQLEMLGIAPERTGQHLNDRTSNIAQARTDFAVMLSQSSKKEFLKILLEIPSEMISEVNREFSALNNGHTIREEFATRFGDNAVLERRLCDALLRRDVTRTAECLLLQAARESPKALLETLERLPLEHRATAATIPPYLLLQLTGDDLVQYKASLSGDLDGVISAKLHRSVLDGDGLAVARLLFETTHRGAQREVREAFQSRYGTSLGQYLHDSVARISSEQRIAIEAAIKGDPYALLVAGIRHNLGFGQAAVNDPDKIWKLLSALPLEERRFLNENFEKYLSPVERRQLGENAPSLEWFLKRHLKDGPQHIALKILETNELTPLDLARWCLDRRDPKGDLFASQVMPLLLAEKSGTTVMESLRTDYLMEGAALRATNKNFEEWVLQALSGANRKEFLMFLADPRAARNREQFERAIKNDSSGVSGVVADLFAGDIYTTQKKTIERLFADLENAQSLEERNKIRRMLDAELKTFNSLRSPYLQIKDVATEFAVSSVSTVASGVVIVFTGGAALPVALAISGGVGIGSRVGTHIIMDGTLPDGTTALRYGQGAVLDVVSVGAGRLAIGVTANVATRLGTHAMPVGAQYVARMAVAGAAGGATFGFFRSASEQVIRGQFDPASLAYSTGQAALLGGLFTAAFSVLPANRITHRSTSQSTVIDGKTPLVTGEARINPSVSYEQRAIYKSLSPKVGEAREAVTGTLQIKHISTARSALPSQLTASDPAISSSPVRAGDAPAYSAASFKKEALPFSGQVIVVIPPQEPRPLPPKLIPKDTAKPEKDEQPKRPPPPTPPPVVPPAPHNDPYDPQESSRYFTDYSAFSPAKVTIPGVSSSLFDNLKRSFIKQSGGRVKDGGHQHGGAHGYRPVVAHQPIKLTGIPSRKGDSDSEAQDAVSFGLEVDPTPIPHDVRVRSMMDSQESESLSEVNLSTMPEIHELRALTEIFQPQSMVMSNSLTEAITHKNEIAQTIASIENLNTDSLRHGETCSETNSERIAVIDAQKHEQEITSSVLDEVATLSARGLLSFTICDAVIAAVTQDIESQSRQPIAPLLTTPSAEQVANNFPKLLATHESAQPVSTAKSRSATNNPQIRSISDNVIIEIASALEQQKISHGGKRPQASPKDDDAKEVSQKASTNERTGISALNVAAHLAENLTNRHGIAPEAIHQRLAGERTAIERAILGELKNARSLEAIGLAAELAATQVRITKLISSLAKGRQRDDLSTEELLTESTAPKSKADQVTLHEKSKFSAYPDLWRDKPTTKIRSRLPKRLGAKKGGKKAAR